MFFNTYCYLQVSHNITQFGYITFWYSTTLLVACPCNDLAAIWIRRWFNKITRATWLLCDYCVSKAMGRDMTGLDWICMNCRYIHKRLLCKGVLVIPIHVVRQYSSTHPVRVPFIYRTRGLLCRQMTWYGRQAISWHNANYTILF